MNIPNEVLFYIFQYLNSPRYLVTFSLVCKEWNSIATQPYFYQTIIIYNQKQLQSFINTAYNTRHCGNHIGCYVKHLIILFTDPISNNTMSQLQLSCPNLLTIYYNLDFNSFNSYDNSNNIKYELLGYWRNLTQLPSWYKEDRFAIISSYKSTLKNFVLYPTLTDLNDILSSNPINGLHLFKSAFTQLKELCIDFSEYQLPFNMNLNYLNVIHYCCPTITKLTIINALMYKTDIQNKKKKKRSLQQRKYQQKQPNQISFLCFENLTIDNPSFFISISKKYPLLQSLLLYNVTFIDNQQSHEEYQSVIKKIITMELPNLNELGVTIANNAYHYWPNDALLTWLHDHPNQIKYLHWPFTIYPTSTKHNIVTTNKNTLDKNKESENDKQQLQQPYNYIPIYQDKPKINFMNHLNTLTLKLSGENTKITLDHLSHGNRGIISKTITTLTIEPLDGDLFVNKDKLTFYIYNWLDALPVLKRLYVHYLDVCLYEKSNGNHIQKKPIGRPPKSKASRLLKLSKLSNKSTSKLLSSAPHSLEELTLFRCSIKSMNSFSLLCQQCPKLTILENYNCQFFIKEKETKKYHSLSYYTLLYVPHSSFKKLTFQGMFKLDNESMEPISNYDLFVKMIPFSLKPTLKSTPEITKIETETETSIEASSLYNNNKKYKKKNQHDSSNNDGKGPSYFFDGQSLDSKQKPLVNIVVNSVDVLNFGGRFLIH